MRPEWLWLAAETVVDREQDRDERTLRLIAGQRTEGRRVAEEREIIPINKLTTILARSVVAEQKQTAAFYDQPSGLTAWRPFVLLLAAFCNKICLD